MALGELLDAIESRRPTVTIYSSAPAEDLARALETRHVDLEVESLPPGAADSFLVVREGGTFLASIPLSLLEPLFCPNRVPRWATDLEQRSDASAPATGNRSRRESPTGDRSSPDEPAAADVVTAGRLFFEHLEETVFSSIERRHLLGATRTIETRAWQVGHGTLRVGFQSLSAMADQVPVYRRLGQDTDLDVHVYGSSDWEPPSIRNVTVHADGGEIGEYWFLAFDGAGNPADTRGLLAREREPGGYHGAWTTDSALVRRLLERIEVAATE